MQSENQFTVITTHLQSFLVSHSGSRFLQDLHVGGLILGCAFLQLVLPQFLHTGFLHFLQLRLHDSSLEYSSHDSSSLE